MVSIVITYCEGDKNFLSTAIGSCLEQGYIELIVVNSAVVHCCGDEALCWIANYANKYINISEDKGIAHARNAGIRESKGDKILLLDADDFLYPFVVEKMNCCDADIVYGDYTSNGNYIKTQQELNIDLFKSYNPIPLTSLFKRSVWEKVGGFSEGVAYDDYHFYCKAFACGCSFKHVDDFVYEHTNRQNSLTYRLIKDKNPYDLNQQAIQPLP